MLLVKFMDVDQSPNLEVKLQTSVFTLPMLQQQLTLLPVLLDSLASQLKLSNKQNLIILLVLKILIQHLQHL